ncbi:hypothetical protein ACSBR1_012007 [Camellia fascicularis]
MEPKVLDWKTRHQISLGTTKGLAYLHEECRDCIIHCDIKPANILLDVDFTPKVADFGLTKLLGREFNKVLTTMRGTTGYLVPEWILRVAITNKADIYSYDDVNHRPSMGEVVQILKGISDVKLSLIPRLLQALVNNN